MRSCLLGSVFLTVFLVPTIAPFTTFAAIDNNRTNAPADVVIGQPDFASSGSGVSSVQLRSPMGMDTDGRKLIIADWSNQRLLIYNTIPTTNGASADVVLGQPDFTTSVRYYPDGVMSADNTNYDRPQDVAICAGKLFVTDRQTRRVLVYNTIPISNLTAADFALFVPHGGEAAGVACNNNTLVVLMALQHTYIYTPIPTSNVTYSARITGLSQNFIRGGVVLTDTELFVTDFNRNRVLIWNTIPTADTTPATADIVIGQADFDGMSANQGRDAPGSDTLKNPTDIYHDGKRLYVFDGGNNRILVFNNVPTTNGASADIVLGQPDFISNAANNGGIGANTLHLADYSAGITSDGKRLFVSDRNNNRVLIYKFIRTPTNFTSVSQTTDFITLSVDSFETVFGTAKYLFSRSDGVESGWISSPTWTDTGLTPNTNYTYTVKYGTGDGIESQSVSLAARTAGPPPGGGRGSMSPGRGGDAPQVDLNTRRLLPEQPETVSPLYGPANVVPPAPAGVSSPMRERLAARIEKRITEYPRLRTMLLKMLERLDRRLAARNRR